MYGLAVCDLIEQRPDIVKAWLRAELDAQLMLADPGNADEIIGMAMDQTTGFPRESMHMALYGAYPDQTKKVRFSLPFAFTPEAVALIEKATTFLHEIKTINVPQLRDVAVMEEFTEEVLAERGLTAPIGVVPVME